MIVMPSLTWALCMTSMSCTPLPYATWVCHVWGGTPKWLCSSWSLFKTTKTWCLFQTTKKEDPQKRHTHMARGDGLARLRQGCGVRSALNVAAHAQRRSQGYERNSFRPALRPGYVRYVGNLLGGTSFRLSLAFPKAASTRILTQTELHSFRKLKPEHK